MWAAEDDASPWRPEREQGLTLIYHITHVGNLASMIDRDLICDHDRQTGVLPSVNIGHTHIKERRSRRAVPCGAGGTLADYVPFYFAPRSPMLYAVHRRNVEGVTARQEDIVYLVTTCESVLTAGLAFAFTDGHAIMGFSGFYDDLRHLDKIDWEVMAARYWNDTDGTGERPRKRQAEFLVHKRFPWSLITEIGVMTEAARRRVGSIITEIEHQPEIIVRREWYY
ncbi:DUF4433 domain-containing protein [Sphaerisporangium melleum]|uniref:type II toxin-antitoxin system toxin DNA ADP-ribosyl transferase DarT n=1 Tax=Sphaerisporangium melleum TaxID=321316 RepID=UPI00227A3ED2|nr:DUF4433 domain-containing protein [Sphaerisporangium melleum]